MQLLLSKSANKLRSELLVDSDLVLTCAMFTVIDTATVALLLLLQLLLSK
jgi:hypothetical protein